MKRKLQFRISVIVPVYNKEAYLAQCIDSILAQTYGNLELLLVDDGSVDESGAICDRYGEKDARVRVFHQENGGPTAAVLTGLKEASGDYYAFVDSDDYVSRQMLQKMAERLTGRAGEIVCCNHVLEKQRETLSVVQPLPAGVYEESKLTVEVKDKLLGREERIITMSRCMKLCEKSVFEGNEKYYDTTIRIGDDFNLMYPALLAASRVVMMEEAFFYHYRYVEDSLVHAYDPDSAAGVDRWYEAIRQIVCDRKVAGGVAALDREYCYMMMYVMKNELRNPAKDYVQRIQQIYMQPAVRERILNTPLSVKSRSNALLYLGMQYPHKTLLHMLRMIVRRYDRLAKRRKASRAE